MRSLLWPHCVDPAPALATLIGVPFRQGIAAASDSTPGSTVLSVRASWCFPSGYGEGFLRRKRRAIQRLQVWCRDFVGVIRSGTIARGGRRTMGALDRKALPRVSQRSAHRKRRLSTTSGRGRSFRSQHGILHPAAFRYSRNNFALLVLCPIRRGAGRRGGAPMPHRDAVHRPRPHQREAERSQGVSLSSPCDGQNQFQMEQALVWFLVEPRRSRPFHKRFGTLTPRRAGMRPTVAKEPSQAGCGGAVLLLKKEGALRTAGAFLHGAFSGPLRCGA
ncbi:hypothetical protein TcYC6_0021270 [Trypanosoma cruzi]|nr:hypothetical protein TcYC6_0021270 [Trypanosoma cruzi]